MNNTFHLISRQDTQTSKFVNVIYTGVVVLTTLAILCEYVIWADNHTSM